MKLKAAFLIGLLLEFGGTLNYFLRRVLIFLLLRGELLDLFLRRLGAVFRSLRPVFRLLQAFSRAIKRASIVLRSVCAWAEAAPVSKAIRTASVLFLYMLVASRKENVKCCFLLNRFRRYVKHDP